jgi:hypothetical protein
MRDEEWIETLEDGRRVKFTNQELDDWAFVTAEVEGNKVVSSIVLTEATKPLRGGKSWCERGDSKSLLIASSTTCREPGRSL